MATYQLYYEKLNKFRVQGDGGSLCKSFSLSIRRFRNRTGSGGVNAEAAVYELFVIIGTKPICQISLIPKYFLVKSQGLYDI